MVPLSLLNTFQFGWKHTATLPWVAKLGKQRAIHLGHVHPSPGIWVGKDSSEHGSWTAKPTEAHFGRCDELNSLNWKRNTYSKMKLRKRVKGENKVSNFTQETEREAFWEWLALSKLWIVTLMYLFLLCLSTTFSTVPDSFWKVLIKNKASETPGPPYVENTP